MVYLLLLFRRSFIIIIFSIFTSLVLHKQKCHCCKLAIIVIALAESQMVQQEWITGSSDEQITMPAKKCIAEGVLLKANSQPKEMIDRYADTLTLKREIKSARTTYSYFIVTKWSCISVSILLKMNFLKKYI